MWAVIQEKQQAECSWWWWGAFIRESSLPLQEKPDAPTTSYRGPKIFLECAPWWMSKQFGELAIGLHHKEEVGRYQLSQFPGLSTVLREEQQGRKEGNKSNRIKKGGKSR